MQIDKENDLSQGSKNREQLPGLAALDGLKKLTRGGLGLFSGGKDKEEKLSFDDIGPLPPDTVSTPATNSTGAAMRPADVPDLDELDESKATIRINEIDNLKNLTENKVIELASGDIEEMVEWHERQEVTETLGKKAGSYYRDVIFALIQIRLPEPEARRDWAKILKHKYEVSEKLGRNVGIHVATLDYYTNVKKAKINPKVVDAHDYADTASQAITDELTKAYNRRFFEEEFRRRFMRSRVSGVFFSFLMLDIDHFKVYNDRNGHIQGDLALIETVRILHTICSWRDIVARYGGEEFGIMLHAQPLEQAIKTAESIRQAIYDYRFVNENVLPGGRMSVSIGVTSYRDDIQTPREMIEEADIALYRAKRASRNCVKSFLKT